MTSLFVFSTLVFTLFALYKTVAPFLGSRRGQLRVELLDDELRKIELLVARKAALVQSLRDIEYDWQTNKISEEDYTRFKKSYERQAIGIMRRLDAIHGGRAWEQSIDDELNKRLNTTPTEIPGATNDAHVLAQAPETETQAPETTDAPNDSSDPDNLPICQQCQTQLRADDIFCARCGHRVAQDSPDQEPKNINKSLRPEIAQ